MLKYIGKSLKWILPLLAAALVGTQLPGLLPPQIALLLAGIFAMVWGMMWLLERLGQRSEKPPPKPKPKPKKAPPPDGSLVAWVALMALVGLPLVRIVLPNFKPFLGPLAELPDVVVYAGLWAIAALIIWALFFSPALKRFKPKQQSPRVNWALLLMIAPLLPEFVLPADPQIVLITRPVAILIGLALYGANIRAWAKNPPPKPSLKKFYGIEGRLYADAEFVEEVTPANWAIYKPEPPKKKKKADPPANVAEVVLWADTALVMERGGRQPRVLQVSIDEDKYFIQEKEDLRAVLDLRTQVRMNPAIKVLTGNAVEVTIGLGVSFQIVRDGDGDEIAPYLSEETAIINAAYKPPVLANGDQSPWDEAPLEIAARHLHNLVSEYGFNELFQYDRQTTDDIPPRKRIADELNEATRGALVASGITLNAAFLLEISFDESLATSMRKMWAKRSRMRLEQNLALLSANTQAEAATRLIKPVAKVVDTTQYEVPMLIEGTVTTHTPVDLVRLKQLFLAIIQVLDYLDRGVQTIPADLDQDDQPAHAYANWLRWIQHSMVELLEQFGLEEIPGVGAEFDPHIHEGAGVVPTSPQPPGTVHRVERRGYFYQGELLRPARVWVAGED